MPLVNDKRSRSSQAILDDPDNPETKDRISNVATYRQGIRALYRGSRGSELCTIVATGDAPGHSQVLQFVDSQGKIFWDSEENFTVIDQNVVQMTQDTLEQVLRSLSASTSRSQR